MAIAAEPSSFVNATTEIAIHKIRNAPSAAQMPAVDGNLLLVLLIFLLADQSTVQHV